MSNPEQPKYLRFPLSYRVEHLITLVSFTILSITGLVQKFPDVGISQWTIIIFGGIEALRIVHRVAAVILMLASVYHIAAAAYRVFVLRYRPVMLPTMADMRNGVQGLLYNLRLGKTRPQQGRYTFEEKFEYWALVWGTVVMILTGWILWNPIAAASILPGEFIPAAKEVHGGEALLAVLAIIVWHMYHVHLRHFNKSMFTGYMTEHEMLEDHPLELADIKAGRVEQPPPPDVVARRQRVFLPIVGAVVLVTTIAILVFATFERTAIETVANPREVAVFVPLPPTPFPTPAPSPTPAPIAAGANSWESGIGSIFQSQCSLCHGPAVQMGNINLTSYTSALAGGLKGPGIVPGNPEASSVIVIQVAGGHPAQFSPEQLELIREWIEAGAPE
jgi:cytochrome b subunit of formate dehydrogenase/mono/diheme cytochrome c family protein